MAIGELWRHKKGGVYEVVSRTTARRDYEEGELLWREGPDHRIQWDYHVTDPIKKGEEMVAYHEVVTLKCWVRPAWMFDDGRFVKVEEGA